MSDERNRDEQTERLIRAALSGPKPAGWLAGPCLDAEAVAAWSEGGLDAVSAARVEAHLSSCASCQAVLAALAVTAPEVGKATSPGVVPFWQRWSMRWVIPAMAGASAVLVWSLLRVPQPEEQAVDMAMAPPTAPAVAAPAAGAASTAPAPTSPRADEVRAAGDGGQRVAPARALPADGAALADSAAKAVEPSPEFRAEAVRATQMALPAPAPPPPRAQAVGNAMASAVPASPAAPASTPPPAVVNESIAVRAEAPVIQNQSGERSFSINANQAQAELGRSSGNQVSAVVPTIALEFAVQPLVGGVADAVASAPAAGSGVSAGRAGGGRGGAVAAGRGRIAAAAAPPPPMPVRWRVMSTGAVERLLAGSTTWERVPVEAGLVVTAGHAPSPQVCWLVGRGGAVLRTVDGRTFIRLSVPDAVDLIGVTATSLNEARVTAAGGRVFTTTDGGQTWR